MQNPIETLRGVCDCHMHVFGPAERYPGSPDRSYSPAEMGLGTYRPLAAALGIERIVIVQPSAYGTDNRCTLDGLKSFGPQARAVVVIDPGISDAELDALHESGVRGIRLNLMTPRIDDAAVAEQALADAARRIERLGWHVQIYADLDLVALMAPAVRRSRVPVVFDHMGGAKATLRGDDHRFAVLTDLVGEARCWVKLSGADIVTWETSDFAGATPFARALVKANAARLVWGSDWPHLVHQHAGTGDAAPPIAFRPVVEDALLSSLRGWAGDEATLRAILVDNPARLYGF